MQFSRYLGYTFLKATIGTGCHAIYPDIFVTHSSDIIKKLANEMEQVGCRKSN